MPPGITDLLREAKESWGKVAEKVAEKAVPGERRT